MEKMNGGYDQPTDPPAYSQAGPGSQPAYPGVAPPVNVTSQPTHINNVVVQGGGGTTVLLQHNDYLCCSIFSCLCCFWPLGLVAIIFSVMSRDAATCGNVQQARVNARIALGLNVASVIATIIIVIVLAIIYSNAENYD